MQEKYLIIPNRKDFKVYLDKNFNSFILPLKDYSIGFDVYFNIDEINELSKKYKIYVMINKFIHKTVKPFNEIYSKFNDNIMFIVEDIGFLSIIPKERFVLFENHIESNYKAINYLYNIGITNVCINNDLTINELLEIRKKCNSKLYYFLINRNNLFYSKRKLVSNYNSHYNINTNVKEYNLTEKVSSKRLMIKEEDDGTIISNTKLFVGNKYINDLEKLDYLIINTTTMSELELKVTLEHYNDVELINILDIDDYFLNNKIEYKVGKL